MKAWFLLLLPISLLASASDALPPSGVRFFSVCGNFHARTSILTTQNGDKLKLTGAAIPKKSGRVCARGDVISWGKRRWFFEPSAVHPNSENLKFPVMICAEINPETQSTPWRASQLHFIGTLPEREKLSESVVWCADGTHLPEKVDTEFKFNAGDFRPMESPQAPYSSPRSFERARRSGFSVGNQ